MTYTEYIGSLRGKSVTVLGMGVSNRPLIQLLCKAGARVTACDQNGGIGRAEWEALGVTLCLGEGYLDNIAGDIIYRTPGLRPDHPSLLRAAADGARVTSEMADFAAICPCPIYGVTGSDGKTTTTTLIAEMLREGGRVTHLGGNIGTPLLTRAGDMTKDDLCVAEMSSFQLMDMQKSPQVAVVTNITPNHLDWHRDMKEYIAAKHKILENQPSGGVAVLNRDNKITAGFKGKYNTRYFGKHMIQDGLIEGLLPVADIKLRGWHNVENVMAAMTAVRGVVSDDAIREAATTFAGVRHRDEWVGAANGVSYYNDSIGSSPSRTIATLLSHPGRVHLIAGGRDKKVPFDALCGILPDRAACLYLIGEAAGQIEAAARRASQTLPIVRCKDLPEAVAETQKRTAPGDTVLLSPACTSFDQYANFEERGDHFREIVKGLG